MRSLGLVSIIAGFVGALSTACLAQDVATGGGRVALTDLTFNERTVEGGLDACELTYLVGFEDYIYRKGDLVFLRGSISMSALSRSPDKPPGIFLKVTAFDLVGANPQFAPLNYVFLSAKGQ
jgi:hypothetical protein